MVLKRPETPSELRSYILDEYTGLSNRLQRIARFAIDHPSDMALEPIASIAEQADVQPSALIRFAKALGYSGFSELRQVYRVRLTDVASSYSERLRRLRHDQPDPGALTPRGVLRQFCETNRLALDNLAEGRAGDVLADAVRVMTAGNCIYLCAQRRSFPIVVYMTYALAQVRVRACLLDGSGGMLRQQANRMVDGDVLFAASFHPYAPETVDTVGYAIAHGIPVVVLTDSPLSPVARDATVCLEVHDAESHNFRSLTASMCLVQALTVAIGLARIPGTTDQS